ncbi:hypothetical protein [Tenacibaculum piscium]|uniref:hypothetical protein n=1 Tax=Tenacibaculum piscium TaxID=1458515 RepID=UPI001F20734B|nr:hypothetical protein [Tenacibaculum piscium]
MLEVLLLKYLTKKGIIIYFIGQVIFIALFAYYIFGIQGYSIHSGENIFFIGMLIIILLWMGVCLLLWKKPKEESKEQLKEIKDK